MKMYELVGNYYNLMELLENGDIEQAIIEEALNQNKADIEEKAESYCKIIKMLEGDIAAMKEEEKRIATNRRILENRVSMLKANLFESMKATGNKSLKGKVFTLRIQKNPPSLDMEDIENIPEEYKIFRVEANKRAMMEYIKNGGEINGVTLKQGESLRIK